MEGLAAQLQQKVRHRLPQPRLRHPGSNSSVSFAETQSTPFQRARDERCVVVAHQQECHCLWQLRLHPPAPPGAARCLFPPQSTTAKHLYAYSCADDSTGRDAMSASPPGPAASLQHLALARQSPPSPLGIIAQRMFTFVCSNLGASGSPRWQKAQAHLDLPQAFRVWLLERLVFQYLRVDPQRLLVLLRDACRARGSLCIAKEQNEHAEELQ